MAHLQDFRAKAASPHAVRHRNGHQIGKCRANANAVQFARNFGAFVSAMFPPALRTCLAPGNFRRAPGKIFPAQF
jgi:hypothetical protein